MTTQKYAQYGTAHPPADPDQEFMTVQETAFVIRCSVTWLRRFLATRPHLCGRNGERGRIVTNREQRAAIHQARSGGDPRTGRTTLSQHRRTATQRAPR